MTTTELEYWRLRGRELWADQNPGCHTGASGFDYVAHYSEADKAIDMCWLRQRLIELLRNRL